MKIYITFKNSKKDFLTPGDISFSSWDSLFSLKNKEEIEELDCSKNKLTKLPKKLGSLVNLQKIICNENRLTELPKELFTLVNLEILYLAYNNFTKFPEEISSLINLKRLDFTGNKITKVTKELGSLINLESLWFYKSELTELPKEIGLLTNLNELECSLSKLKTLPLEIIQCRSLRIINYTNKSEKLHPLVKRFFSRIYQTKKEFPDFKKNYDPPIKNITRQNIFNVLKDPVKIDGKILIKELIDSDTLKCRSDLLEYIKDTTENDTLGITFKDLMLSVWNRIRKSDNFDDILKSINKEMESPDCKNLLGRLTRLINSLIGFYDDVSDDISIKKLSADEFTNVIKVSLIKYDSENEFIKVIKEYAVKELTEKGYSLEEIEPWISKIKL